MKKGIGCCTHSLLLTKFLTIVTLLRIKKITILLL
nr:MAG TPA: hypothetical protein [Caudoviricetes sp.]